LFDNSLLSLPVNLFNLVDLSKSNPSTFIFENTLTRLIVVLLNEQDNRISNKVSLFNNINDYFYFQRPAHKNGCFANFGECC
jgi:hypothetical protein